MATGCFGQAWERDNERKRENRVGMGSMWQIKNMQTNYKNFKKYSST